MQRRENNNNVTYVQIMNVQSNKLTDLPGEFHNYFNELVG